jgi:CheY-like chemotaxis protein
MFRHRCEDVGLPWRKIIGSPAPRSTYAMRTAAFSPGRAVRAPHRALGRERHGRRHGRAHTIPDFRTFFYHQGARHGHRARPVDRVRQLAKSPFSGERSLKGSETILLAEDDALVRALTRKLLCEAGYHVLEAESSEAALALAERHSATIHLLLTDVVMPRMGGRQLADQLCARRPETKVLFMSGYTNDSIIRHGLVDSAVELLQKPFTRVALLRRVRGLLDA